LTLPVGLAWESFGEAKGGAGGDRYRFYGQDSWKLTPRFTLVHAGEIVANESMMRQFGSGASASIGNALAPSRGGSDVHLHVEGNVFHGTPDQRYVQSFIDSVITQLRNSSRTWAFNPTGK
jgi:hypothetical protein